MREHAPPADTIESIAARIPERRRAGGSDSIDPPSPPVVPFTGCLPHLSTPFAGSPAPSPTAWTRFGLLRSILGTRLASIVDGETVGDKSALDAIDVGILCFQFIQPPARRPEVGKLIRRPREAVCRLGAIRGLAIAQPKARHQVAARLSVLVAIFVDLASRARIGALPGTKLRDRVGRFFGARFDFALLADDVLNVRMDQIEIPRPDRPS